MGSELVASRPDAFPLEGHLFVGVIFGMTPPEVEGYDVITAIEEVLVDVGLFADERQVSQESHTVDRSIGDSYTVTLELE